MNVGFKVVRNKRYAFPFDVITLNSNEYLFLAIASKGLPFGMLTLVLPSLKLPSNDV